MRRWVVRRLNDRSRVYLITLAVVPLAFGAIHATPKGVPLAEGCSGAPSGTVTSVSLLSSSISIGRDGFFPIFVSAPGLGGAAVLPLLNVQITDGQANVPGAIALVRTQQPGAFIFGWVADAPLTAGAVLQASASSGSLPPNTATLLVSDASPTLAAPTLSLGQWSRHTYDVGTTMTCTSSGLGACSPVYFGATVEETARARLMGSTSSVPIVVAWEISIAEVDGKGTFAQTPPTDFVYDTQPQQISMDLHFSPGAGERCVRVVARDLRTSAVAMSEPSCSTPDMLSETSDDRIGQCGAAPPGYEARWCEVSATLGRPCPGSGGSGGIGGSGMLGGSGGAGIVAGNGGRLVAGTGGSQPADAGEGGANGETGGSGSGNAGGGDTGDDSGGSSSGTDADAAGAPDEDGGKRTLTESCGCRTWRSGSPSFGGLAVLALALGLFLRKRRPHPQA